jgi:hypothetical protein
VALIREQRPAPHYFKYRLVGDSHLEGCEHGDDLQAYEVCEKLERLLINVVKMMMVTWEVPSWQGFTWRGKVIKYMLWIELMSAGEIQIGMDGVRFLTTTEDLGY